MAQAGRWVYCPMTQRRIGRRLTVRDRLRRWLSGWQREKIDVYMVTGFFEPTYPRRR